MYSFYTVLHNGHWLNGVLCPGNSAISKLMPLLHLQKAGPSLSQASSFKVANLIGSVYSMVIYPLLHLLCYNSAPLVQGIVIWDHVSMGQILWKPSDNGAGWDPMGRKGKLIPRVCANSGQDESLLLLKWKESNVNSLPPSDMDGSVLGAACWSLLLEDWP